MLRDKMLDLEPYPADAVNIVKDIFKEWLKTVGLPHYHSFNKGGNAFNATEAIQQLLITLVDKP